MIRYDDIPDGTVVQVYDDCGTRLTESAFRLDVVKPAFRARPNWTNISGLRGVFYEGRVKFPCGSLIGIPEGWLRVITPLEQLAEAIDE